MNKLAKLFAFSSMFVAVNAFATALPAGGAITTNDCATIGENVTISTSAGVVAAYSCNETSNASAVSTCHEAGSRRTRVHTCVSVDAGNDGQVGTSDDEYNHSSCPTGDGSTSTPGEFTITADYTGFVVNTRGGGLASAPLLGACTPATVDALLPF